MTTPPDWSAGNAVIALGAKVLVAPKGTPLPVDTQTAWNAAFKTMGAVSEKGMTISPSRSTTVKKIWQTRSDVMIIPNGQTFDIKHELVEWTATTFGLWYGGGTWVAEVSSPGEFSFEVSADPPVDERAFGYEWTVDGFIWRLGIGRGNVSAVGDAVLVNNDWTPVETTVSGLSVAGQPIAVFFTNDPSVTPAV